MIKIKKEGVLLEPTKRQFENQAVLNPGCIRVGNNTHVFYRAVSKNNYISTIGYCNLEGPLEIVQRRHRSWLLPRVPLVLALAAVMFCGSMLLIEGGFSGPTFAILQQSAVNAKELFW